jgi:hypothetical protein
MTKPTIEEAETAIKVLQWLALKCSQFNREQTFFESIFHSYPDKELLDIASRIQDTISLFEDEKGKQNL